MNLIKSIDFFNPSLVEEEVHVIGVGAIGSCIVELLARIGINDIIIWDEDVVESKNVANQFYFATQENKDKVQALKETVQSINPNCNVRTKGFWKGQPVTGHVFLAVDNIEIRKDFVKENQFNPMLKTVFDTRMRLTDAQAYGAIWADKKLVTNLQKSMDFTKEEADAATPTNACGSTLSIAPTVRMITSLVVSNFINYCKGDPIKKVILVDAFNFSIESY